MTNVLIIEDELIAAKHCAESISKYSNRYNVSGICRNKREVLESYERTVPDIIFSDIRLGNENGLDVVQGLRDKGWKGKLVIMSVYGCFSYAKQAIHLGVEEYLIKPIFAEDIVKVLEKISSGSEKSIETCVMEALVPGDISYMPRYIKKSLEYLETHYKEQITLSAIAEYSNVSGTYLSSEFSKNIGFSLVTMMNRFRLEISKMLLVDTDSPLDAICHEVGFTDVAYYSRLFKRFYNESPGQYRKNEKAKKIQ